MPPSTRSRHDRRSFPPPPSPLPCAAGTPARPRRIDVRLSVAMVESYVVRAQKLATMSEQTFLASYGQVFRALPYLVGSPEDNVRRIYEQL
jgi:hypothetical protein